MHIGNCICHLTFLVTLLEHQLYKKQPMQILCNSQGIAYGLKAQAERMEITDKAEEL